MNKKNGTKGQNADIEEDGGGDKNQSSKAKVSIVAGFTENISPSGEMRTSAADRKEAESMQSSAENPYK